MLFETDYQMAQGVEIEIMHVERGRFEYPPGYW